MNLQLFYGIVVALVGLSLVICVHELGHYAVARFFNLAIPRLTVGLGPRLLRFKSGETEFVWRLFPLAGGVQIIGIDGIFSIPGDRDVRRMLDKKYLCEEQGKTMTPEEASLLNPERRYYLLNGWRQMAIVLAGPLASLLLCISALPSIAVWEYWRPTMFLHVGVVADVVPNSPAARQFVTEGDYVMVQNTVPPGAFAWNKRPREPRTMADIQVLGKVARFDLSNAPSSLPDLGLLVKPLSDEPVCAPDVKSALAKWPVTRMFFKFVVCATPPSILEGHYRKSLGLGSDGWIGILSMVVRAALLSLREAVFVLAILSGSMFLFNLLPIPPLDGGRAALAFLHVVGRSVPDRFVLRLSVVGFYILVGYLLFLLIRDVSKLLG